MKQSRQESLIYLAVWGLLLAAPLLSLYIRTVNDANQVFDWTEIMIVWRKLALYLLLFLVHNFLLAPLLVHQHRRVAYFSAVAVVVAVFTLYQCNSRPEKPMGHKPPMEQEGRHRPPYRDAPPRDDAVPPREDDAPPHGEPPMAMEGEQPMPPHEGSHRPRLSRPADVPPPILGERDILAVVVLLLMFGANLGLKGWFRSRDDRRRLAELERENLEQQLEYLRYQINPHFFMNTLNNIHALVDIDPEQAKDTIVELSKMMRFVLYEGNKQRVPLSRELEFIRHYVALMQLRYTERVRIVLDLPAEVPERPVPPLVLITFIENAFKHGVSYQRESFIEVMVKVDGDRLQFSCRNSKAETTKRPNDETAPPQQGGVGLANVRKRLNLLFAHDYSLHIRDDGDVYTVDLTFPLKSSIKKT